MNDEKTTFRFTETITVSEIRKNDKYWYYIVVNTTYRTITHSKMYYSTNYLAIKRHRDNMMAVYKERKRRLDQSSYYKSVKVMPTLIERIKAKRNEKIH